MLIVYLNMGRVLFWVFNYQGKIKLYFSKGHTTFTLAAVVAGAAVIQIEARLQTRLQNRVVAF